jgi:hypothetical protein
VFDSPSLGHHTFSKASNALASSRSHLHPDGPLHLNHTLVSRIRFASDFGQAHAPTHTFPIQLHSHKKTFYLCSTSTISDLTIAALTNSSQTHLLTPTPATNPVRSNNTHHQPVFLGFRTSQLSTPRPKEIGEETLQSHRQPPPIHIFSIAISLPEIHKDIEGVVLR